MASPAAQKSFWYALRVKRTSITKRRPRGRLAGFTLIELLITMALFSVIGAILVQIFGVFRSSFDQGTVKVGVHSFATVTMDKITPMIVSAVPNPSQGDEFQNAIPALPVPPGEERLRFVSGVNHFGPTDLSKLPIINYYYYRIRARAVPDPKDTADPVSYDIILQQFDPGDVNYTGAAPFTAPRTRLLASSDSERGEVKALNFSQAGDNVRVYLRVKGPIRGAVGQVRRDETTAYELTNITPIPFFNTKNTL